MATSHSALTPRSISKTDDASRKRSTADTAEEAAPAAKRHQAVLGVSTTPTLQAGNAANSAAQFRGEAPFAVQLGGLVGGMASKRRMADLQSKARSSLGTGGSSSSSRPATLTPLKGSMTAVPACPHVFRPVQLRAVDDDLGDGQPHQAAGPGPSGLPTAAGSGSVADGPGAPAQLALGAAGSAAAADAALGAQPAPPAQDTHAPATAQGQQVVAEQQPDVPAVNGISSAAVHMPAPTALHSTAQQGPSQAAGDTGVMAGSAPPAAVGSAAAETPSTSSAAAAGKQAASKPAVPTLGSAGSTPGSQPGLLIASDMQKAAATAGSTLEAPSGSMLASCNQAPAAATQVKAPAFSFAPFAAPARDQSTAAYSTPSVDNALSAPATSTPVTAGFGGNTGMASFGIPTGVSSAAAAGSNSQPGKPAPSGAPGAWGLGSTSSRAPSGFNFGGQSAALGGTASSGGPHGAGVNAAANTPGLPPAAGPTSSGFPGSTAGGSSGIAFASGPGQGVAAPGVPGGVGGVSGGMSSPAGGFGTSVAGPFGSGPPNGQPAVFGNAQPDIGAAAAGAPSGFTAGNASGASAGAASRRRLVSRRRGK